MFVYGLNMLFFTVLVISVTAFDVTHSACPYPSQNGEKCEFLAAPSGKTPPCALPGLTYCNDVPNYPSDLVAKLLMERKIAFDSIFVDEVDRDYPEVQKNNPSYHSRL